METLTRTFVVFEIHVRNYTFEIYRDIYGKENIDKKLTQTCEAIQWWMRRSQSTLGPRENYGTGGLTVTGILYPAVGRIFYGLLGVHLEM